MNLSNAEKIKQGWRQSRTPVIYRRGIGYPLLMKLPYREGNRAWLKSFKRINPEWDSEMKYWILPQAWFNDLVSKTLSTWQSLYDNTTLS